MHPSTAKAQAHTIREWAEIWEREALTGAAEGYAEVTFLMRRSAAAIERAMGLPVERDVVQHTEMPVAAFERMHARDG
jgi:hypothetical protein